VHDWLDVAATYAETATCGASYYGHNISMEPMYSWARPRGRRRPPHAGGLGAARQDVAALREHEELILHVHHGAEHRPGSGSARRGSDPDRRVRAAAARPGAGRPDGRPGLRIAEAGCPYQVSHTTAVEVGDRPVADFLWQRDPWELVDPGDVTQTEPGATSRWPTGWAASTATSRTTRQGAASCGSKRVGRALRSTTGPWRQRACPSGTGRAPALAGRRARPFPLPMREAACSAPAARQGIAARVREDEPCRWGGAAWKVPALAGAGRGPSLLPTRGAACSAPRLAKGSPPGVREDEPCRWGERRGRAAERPPKGRAGRPSEGVVVHARTDRSPALRRRGGPSPLLEHALHAAVGPAHHRLALRGSDVSTEMRAISQDTSPWSDVIDGDEGDLPRYVALERRIDGDEGDLPRCVAPERASPEMTCERPRRSARMEK